MTFGYRSGLEEELKSSTAVHNLASVRNVIEPYVNAAPKMFIAACATVIGIMIRCCSGPCWFLPSVDSVTA